MLILRTNNYSTWPIFHQLQSMRVLDSGLRNIVLIFWLLLFSGLAGLKRLFSPDMKPDAPKWIDTCYLQNALQKAENDKSIKVFNINIKPATKKGDNYSSDLCRVAVQFSRILDDNEIEESRSLIVKIELDESKSQLVKAMRAFEIEILMMSNILPKMNQMINELGITSFSPQCLLIHQEEPVHLLLEDLMSRRFQMVDRQAGLDLDHCLLAIRNLGRFHATSVAVKEQEPESMDAFSMGVFHKDRPPQLIEMFKSGVKLLAKQVGKWHELSSRISEKLYKLSEVVYEKGIEAAKVRDDEFNVLNHGDFWVNNMMFVYDNLQKPIEHIFLDFQMCFYGSPAIDIHNLFGISTTDEVRLHQREFLLREYYDSLCSTMVKLKCKTKVLTFDNLQEILRQRRMYEAIVAFVWLPMTLIDISEVRELDEFFSDSDGNLDHPAFNSEVYKEVVLRLLPLYDSIGLLDD